ncbi:MAG: DUF2339 domain-containing protein [Acidobacteriota bacterium]
MDERDLLQLRSELIELRRRVLELERRSALSPGPAIMQETAQTVAETAPIPLELADEATIPPAPPPIAPPPLSLPLRPPRTAASLESVIGGQWLNRIGIAAVLIGTSYFLKYAFENNWIGPAGRVSIGLLVGIGVVLWSEVFRKRGHEFFSYSLKIVGIGILYLSLWASFQVFHLVPAAVAFGGMVVVTSATALIAVRQNAQILAALALAGGYLTPVLLSTGENHALTLFSYLALLNAAMLVLSLVKPWHRIAGGAFLATLLLYVAWHASWYTRDQLTLAVGFTTLFFVMFLVAPLMARQPEAAGPVPSTASPVLMILILANAVAYFAQLNILLWKEFHDWLAWLAVLLAAVYVLAGALIRRIQDDSPGVRTLSLVHVAAAIGLVTVAVPLKLNAHWITVGWLIEAAALLWVAARQSDSLLRFLGNAALVLGLFRLIFIDHIEAAHLILNARFLTYVLAMAIFAGIALHTASGTSKKDVHTLSIIVLNILALLAINLEVADFSRRNASGHLMRDFTFSAVWMIYSASLMAAGFYKRSSFTRWMSLILMAVTIIKVFFYDLSELERGYRILSFIALGVILLAISFVYQRNLLKLGDETSHRS